MDNIPDDAVGVDINKVIAILQRDNPKELERAMLLVRVQDLVAENADMKAKLEGTANA